MSAWWNKTRIGVALLNLGGRPMVKATARMLGREATPAFAGTNPAALPKCK